jgi:hypothetical protein
MEFRQNHASQFYFQEGPFHPADLVSINDIYLCLKVKKYIYSNHLSHLQVNHKCDTALKHAISALILKIKLLCIYSNMFYIMFVCSDVVITAILEWD